MDRSEVCAVYLLRSRADGAAEVLLGHKRTPRGLGRIVGIGGGIESGESVTDAAVREVLEETGLRISAADLRPAGVLDYVFPGRTSWSQRSYVFLCHAWSGHPVETDEIAPAWFSVDDLPLDRMWDDASRWLPGVLRGGTVEAEYTFDDDLATVVAERLRGVLS